MTDKQAQQWDDICRARFSLAHTAADSVEVSRAIHGNAFEYRSCALWLGEQQRKAATPAGGRETQ